ncbi:MULTISPECIES: tyrosine-type recombinase/integrase [unclassified Microbacterium]|uniref:tyrosine-type recombinase/integrase n=1 Tax=unclassified Microbacterium TaxID=2609290 RepID=UPI00068A4DE8|nr:MULTISPECIES: tyrosine-type recombinase/integrase [unclassified Microbacterium]
MERTGATGQKAEDALKAALLERSALHGEEIKADTAVKVIAEKWYADEVDGRKAYNTERRYREVLDLMVLPGVGMVRIREMSVARCDRFLKDVEKGRGASAAKHAKTVLTGVLGMAARFGALNANPLRDVGSIHIEKKTVEALEQLEVQQMRTLLYADADADAVGRDIPGGVDFMLGTSARIGEMLATRWLDLDLEADVPTVRLHATVIFVKGVGMVVQEHPKTSSSRRIVPLPGFVARMLLGRVNEARHPELVFPSHRGLVRDPSNFRKGWDAFKERAGYEWVHPHVFRKTAAALVKDPELVSGLLGLADSTVTKTHYLPRATIAPDVRDRLDAMGDAPASTQRKARAVVPINSERRGRSQQAGVSEAG